jgi:hypothetical protein
VRFTVAFLATSDFIALSFSSSLTSVAPLYFPDQGIRYFAERVQFKIDMNEKKNRSDNADDERNEPHEISPVPLYRRKAAVRRPRCIRNRDFKYTMCCKKALWRREVPRAETPSSSWNQRQRAMEER